MPALATIMESHLPIDQYSWSLWPYLWFAQSYLLFSSTYRLVILASPVVVLLAPASELSSEGYLFAFPLLWLYLSWQDCMSRACLSLGGRTFPHYLRRGAPSYSFRQIAPSSVHGSRVVSASAAILESHLPMISIHGRSFRRCS